MADYTDKLTLAAFNAATEGRGNTKLVWGTYTGTGESGEEHPNTLTFEGRPLEIVIRSCDTLYFEEVFTFNYGAQRGNAKIKSGSNVNTPLFWTENSVQWFNSDSAYNQMNSKAVNYWYIALIGT